MKKKLFILSALCLLLSACETNQRSPADERSTHNLDNHITQTVQNAIASNPSLSLETRNINISSNRGDVTLRGSVNSIEIKNAIEAIVKRVPGVKTVDNQLEINRR